MERMKTKQARAQNHTAKSDRKAGHIGTNCFTTSPGTGILRQSGADNGTMHMHEGSFKRMVCLKTSTQNWELKPEMVLGVR